MSHASRGKKRVRFSDEPQIREFEALQSRVEEDVQELEGKRTRGDGP